MRNWIRRGIAVFILRLNRGCEKYGKTELDNNNFSWKFPHIEFHTLKNSWKLKINIWWTFIINFPCKVSHKTFPLNTHSCTKITELLKHNPWKKKLQHFSFSFAVLKSIFLIHHYVGGKIMKNNELWIKLNKAFDELKIFVILLLWKLFHVL